MSYLLPGRALGNEVGSGGSQADMTRETNPDTTKRLSLDLITHGWVSKIQLTCHRILLLKGSPCAFIIRIYTYIVLWEEAMCFLLNIGFYWDVWNLECVFSEKYHKSWPDSQASPKGYSMHDIFEITYWVSSFRYLRKCLCCCVIKVFRIPGWTTSQRTVPSVAFMGRTKFPSSCPRLTECCGNFHQVQAVVETEGNRW